MDGNRRPRMNKFISQGKRHVMSAGGHNFAVEILSAGRDGNCPVSRRDGTVIVRCHGGRAPCNPPSIRQHPPTPATAPSSPVSPCSDHDTRVRNGRRRKTGKITESAKKNNQPVEKSEREPSKPLKKQNRLFSFSEIFFFIVPGKKVSHEKQARKESKEREESKDCRSAKKSWETR